MDFGLLGPLTVSDGARPVTVSAPRQRVLLATLQPAARPGRRRGAGRWPWTCSPARRASRRPGRGDGSPARPRRSDRAVRPAAAGAGLARRARPLPRCAAAAALAAVGGGQSCAIRCGRLVLMLQTRVHMTCRGCRIRWQAELARLVVHRQPGRRALPPMRPGAHQPLRVTAAPTCLAVLFARPAGVRPAARRPAGRLGRRSRAWDPGSQRAADATAGPAALAASYGGRRAAGT